MHTPRNGYLMAGGWKESQTTDSALAVMWAVNGQQPSLASITFSGS